MGAFALAIPSLVSGLFGLAGAAKGPSKAQQFSQNSLMDSSKAATGLSTEAAGLSKTLSSGGQGLIKSGLETTAPAKNYFTAALGNRESALGAAAPEVNTILGQFDAGHKAAAQFSPRGGGRATANNEQPYKQASTIAQVLAQKRAEAAGGLASLGLNEAQLGVNQTGQGISALSPAVGAAGVGVQAANDLGMNELEYQKQQAAQFAGIGSGIGKFLGTMLSGGGNGGGFKTTTTGIS